MRTRVAIRAALAAALAAALLAPPAAGDRSSDPAPQVRVATTGNNSERVKTLAITRRRGAQKRVVMSIGSRSLPSLVDKDQLRVTSELQVTGDCVEPGRRCVGRPYDYSPKVRAHLILARTAHTTGGAGAVALSGEARETCTQRHPDYEHHCVLVITHAGLAIADSDRLPCRREGCFVNLVADAHDRNATPGDLLMVGGQRPGGRVPQDRGRINVVRYRDTVPADFPPTTTSRRIEPRIPLDFRRRALFSKRLPALRRNEQLAVSARMRVDVSRLPYAVRSSARLILASAPHATEPDGFAKSHASGFGEISENNGSNCTQAEGTCTVHKVGIIEIRKSAIGRGGRAVPMYVNLIAVFGPKAPDPQRRDRVDLRKGEISVVRFPPRVNGYGR